MSFRKALLFALSFALTLSASGALQTITPPVYIGPPSFVNTTATTATLDASGEYVAFVFRAPKSGTIDRIHFRATTVTTDGSGLRLRIETVNTSDGLPSGSLAGGGSEVTHTTTTANTWNRGTAGLGAAVSKGDLIAAKLLSPAGSTFNGVIRSALTGLNQNFSSGIFPYVVNAVPTGTKANLSLATFAIEYDDGTTPYIEGNAPIDAPSTGSTFNTGSTPDERGNLFQLPFPARVVGVVHTFFPSASTGAYDVILYDASSTPLATVSVDPDQVQTTGAPGRQVIMFSSAVTLTKDTNYRIAIKPTTANAVGYVTTSVDTSAGGTRLREAMLPSTWQGTTRTDAGAWAESTPDTYHNIALLVDQFDDGVGAGGLAANPISGFIN